MAFLFVSLNYTNGEVKTFLADFKVSSKLIYSGS